MKFCIAVLLLSSLYLATALSDAPWVLIPKGIADNSPYTLALNGLTGLNSLGQALDSGIFGNRGNGQVSNVYNSWYQKVGDAFSYIAEQQLTLEDGSLHNSKSAISIDPETGRRTVVWWSLQQLTGAENFTPGGRNITYDADTDVVTVTTFEGLEQWLAYQTFQPINASDVDNVDNVDNVTVTNPDDVVVNEDGEVDVANPDDVVINEDGEDGNVVVENPDEVNVNEDGEVEVTNPEDPNVPTVEVFNSLGDYLQNFAGYVPQNVDTFADDEFLNNAVSSGVGQFSEGAGLANVNLTNPVTLDTFDDQLGTTFVRLVGDVTSDTDSGQITAVVRCATGSDCSDGPLAYWWWNNVLLG